MAPHCATCPDNLSERYVEALPAQRALKKDAELQKLARVYFKKARKLAPELNPEMTIKEGSAMLLKVLRKTHQHSFNVFELRKTTDKPLKEVFLQAVEEFDLANKLQLSSDKLESVADSLQAAYNNNSYHSAIHPADTTQNAVHVLHKDGLGAALPLLVLFAVLLAAAGHDAAHCGVRNNAVPAELEQVFGKQGSQEHMHAEVTCSLLHQSGLIEDRPAEFAEVCSVVKQLIHATDMALHNEVNGYAVCDDVLQAIAAHKLEYAKWPRKAQLLLCCLLLHWADIRNVAWQSSISAAFAALLMYEQSPAGAAKGSAAAASTAETAVSAAAGSEAPQAAAGTAVAAAVMAATRSSQGSEQQPTLEQLVQQHELAAVAVNQCGFMVNFAASTLQSLHKVLPKAAAKAQQQFDANLAQWDAIINNSSNAAAS